MLYKSEQMLFEIVQVFAAEKTGGVMSSPSTEVLNKVDMIFNSGFYNFERIWLDNVQFYGLNCFQFTPQREVTQENDIE